MRFFIWLSSVMGVLLDWRYC